MAGDMSKWQCLVCAYVYDPEKGDPSQGVEPGTPWEDVPDSFTCPPCGIKKFKKIAWVKREDL